MIVKLVAMIDPIDVAPITNYHNKLWKIVFLAHVDLYFCILNKILPLHGWIQAQVYANDFKTNEWAFVPTSTRAS